MILRHVYSQLAWLYHAPCSALDNVIIKHSCVKMGSFDPNKNCAGLRFDQEFESEIKSRNLQSYF